MISFMFECVLVHYESNKFLNTHEISLLITAFRCAALQPKILFKSKPCAGIDADVMVENFFKMSGKHLLKKGVSGRLDIPERKLSFWF